MILIKRLFYIFFIIALLIGFSSCGIKGSNNFKEVNFNNKTSVQLEYRQNVYNCQLQFVGNELSLNIELGGGGFLCYSIDELLCVIESEGISKSFETEALSSDFLPVVLFSFLKENGGAFTTEEYDEDINAHILSREVNGNRVTVQVFGEGETKVYNIRIT